MMVGCYFTCGLDLFYVGVLQDADLQTDGFVTFGALRPVRLNSGTKRQRWRSKVRGGHQAESNCSYLKSDLMFGLDG